MLSLLLCLPASDDGDTVSEIGSLEAFVVVQGGARRTELVVEEVDILIPMLQKKKSQRQ